jgi:hypothetical protein
MDLALAKAAVGKIVHVERVLTCRTPAELDALVELARDADNATVKAYGTKHGCISATGDAIIEDVTLSKRRRTLLHLRFRGRPDTAVAFGWQIGNAALAAAR